MTKIIFKCLNCGRCCKNLFRKEHGVTSGLALLSEREKDQFPQKLVSPNIGFGWGHTGPKIVVSYQLNTKTCPYLTEDNLCEIYNERPLSCQAFPLISVGHFGTAIAEAKDCLFVEKIESKIGSMNKILPMTPKKFRAPLAWQAIEKINAAISKSMMDNLLDARVMWSFDLKNKEWQIVEAI